MLLGTANGVYCGLPNDGSSFRKCIELSHVTDMQVADDLGLLFVQAGKW